MITLMFLPKRADAAVVIRAAYFRIHADGTLRGPDNGLTATYAHDGSWELGPRRYASFECTGPVYLRVTDVDGSRECLGPFDCVKVVRGAVLTQDKWLGAHATYGGGVSATDLWREIAFLTDR